MPKRPSFQFYPADWLNDINIRCASFELQGFLISLMCILHQSEKYGYLSLDLEERLPKLLGKDRRTSSRLLAEVQDSYLLARDVVTGELYSKRMVQDGKISALRREAGHKGGNPNLVKQKVNQTVKQNPTPSSSTSSSTSKKKYIYKKEETKSSEYGELFDKLSFLQKGVMFKRINDYISKFAEAPSLKQINHWIKTEIKK